jgi:hypothetical protein
MACGGKGGIGRETRILVLMVVMVAGDGVNELACVHVCLDDLELTAHSHTVWNFLPSLLGYDATEHDDTP